MSKMNALMSHNQLHSEALGLNEEVVHGVSVKGDPYEYKLDHEHRKVFTKTGPEEDAVWRDTNASYDGVMALIGRAPNQGVPVEPAVVAEPIDMESVAPHLPGVPE
jgi:hypothetical protein